MTAEPTIGKREHDVTFSIMKAIGIVCIVAGHAAVHTPLCTFVYLFHVSLFFFVAGFLFRDDLPLPPLRYLAGKLRRLYLPFVAYGTVAVLLHNVLLRWHVIGYNFSSGVPIHSYDAWQTMVRVGRVFSFTYYEQPLAPAWFLAALFFSLVGFYAVTFLCRRFFTEHFQTVRLLLIVLLAAAAWAVAARPGLFPGQIFICRIPVIMALIGLGRLYALWRTRIPLRPLWAAGCFVLLAGAAAAGYRVNVGGMVYGNPLLFLLFTCAGCYMVLTLSHRLASSECTLCRWLDRLGRNTLTVMMLHLLAFKLVNLLEIDLYGYPIRYLAFHPVIPIRIAYWWIPYTIVGIVLPLVAAWLYDRISERVRR